MPNLAPVDWMMVLIYLFFVFGAGFSLMPYIKTSEDFLLAGRSLPGWLCGLAFLSISVGSEEVIAMGAAGAKYGLESLQFYLLGAIPAMLFAGLFMMPLYYGSKARSVPEFLGLRFDAKTRTLNASVFALVAIFGAGISLYAMARLMQALHIFDVLLHVQSLGGQWVFAISIAIPAAIMLAYILLGGLGGAMYSQAMQLFVLVAGFLPMVFLGLKRVGGWGGLKTESPFTTYLLAWNGVHGAGMADTGLALGLGIAFGAAFWCTDFRVLQTAMAAKDKASARNAPLIAGAGRVLVPLLLILPGLIAIGLPTPHTSIVVHNDNGAIYHDITVVPQAAEDGRGLVPAKTDSFADPMAGKALLDAHGKPLLDYALATPIMLVHFLPTGLLGLGLAALFACLMSGVAAGITAFNTVFTCDLYQGTLHKGTSSRSPLIVARWAAVGAMVLAVGTACAALKLHNLPEMLLLAFSVLNAPQLATVLLGMFWKRATGHGAFAGLIAGVAAAVLHHGLTVAAGASPGFHGGWIRVLHRYPSGLAQSTWTAVAAFGASLLVTAGVSLVTDAKSETALAGLVHGLTPEQPENPIWWKRPRTAAGAILVAAIVVCALCG